MIPVTVTNNDKYYLTARKEIHEVANAVMDKVPRNLQQFPRPIVLIAQALGYTIHYVPRRTANQFHGCIHERTIYLGTSAKLYQQRFTIGHELGHGELWDGAKEWECSAFAEALLIPRYELLTLVAINIGHPLTLKQWAQQEQEQGIVSSLTARFEVGYNALISALANYGLVRGIDPWAGRLEGDRLYETYQRYYRQCSR